MTTAKLARVRNAALLALGLAIAAAGAYPAQAAILEKPASGSSDHHDCESRQEVKWAFIEYGLKHVKVSRTHDDYVYRVSGYYKPDKKAVESLGSNEGFSSDLLSKSHDYVRYVVIYDACEHSIVERIEPRAEAM